MSFLHGLFARNNSTQTVIPNLVNTSAILQIPNIDALNTAGNEDRLCWMVENALDSVTMANKQFGTSVFVVFGTSANRDSMGSIDKTQSIRYFNVKNQVYSSPLGDQHTGEFSWTPIWFNVFSLG